MKYLFGLSLVGAFVGGFILVHCTDPVSFSPNVPSQDASLELFDASMESGVGASMDASVDASLDSGVDSGK